MSTETHNDPNVVNYEYILTNEERPEPKKGRATISDIMCNDDEYLSYWFGFDEDEKIEHIEMYHDSVYNEQIKVVKLL